MTGRRRAAAAIVFLAVAAAWWIFWSHGERRPARDIGRVLEEGRRITAIVMMPAADKSLQAAAMLSYEPLSGQLVVYHVPTSLALESVAEDTATGSGGGLPLTLESAYAREDVTEVNRRLTRLFGPDLTFTAVMPIAQFFRIIDLMGGIFVSVPTRISFRSATIGTFDRLSDWVEIPQGEDVFFDSDKTRMYLSYRFDGLGLRGQLFRGKRLAASFLQRLKLHLQHDWFRYKLVAAFQYISAPSILSFATALVDVPVDSLDVRALPGLADAGTGVFRMAPREWKESLPRELKPLIGAELTGRRISVQLLNGAGRANVASRLREELMNFPDVDIVEMGNASRRDYEITQIIDRAGRLGSAERIRELLGFGVLRQDINPKIMVDVTIIIGADSR